MLRKSLAGSKPGHTARSLNEEMKLGSAVEKVKSQDEGNFAGQATNSVKDIAMISLWPSRLLGEIPTPFRRSMDDKDGPTRFRIAFLPTPWIFDESGEGLVIRVDDAVGYE
jgi:hypothetical protein